MMREKRDEKKIQPEAHRLEDTELEGCVQWLLKLIFDVQESRTQTQNAKR